MKTRMLIAMLVMLPAIAFAGGHHGGTVRDGSGNLRETWTQKGNRTEIRDSNNNLIREISPSNSSSRDRFDVRDSDGNLVGEIRRGNDD